MTKDQLSQLGKTLWAIVTLDSQDPSTGKKKKLNRVLDFACGSCSLLLNVRSQMGPHGNCQGFLDSSK